MTEPTDIDDDLTKTVIADLEGQNWTDTPMTAHERNLVWMAVRSTLSHQGDRGMAHRDGTVDRRSDDRAATGGNTND